MSIFFKYSHKTLHSSLTRVCLVISITWSVFFHLHLGHCMWYCAIIDHAIIILVKYPSSPPLSHRHRLDSLKGTTVLVINLLSLDRISYLSSLFHLTFLMLYTLRPRQNCGHFAHNIFNFFWMKMYWFQLKNNWSLFPMVQLTISHHWFRE